MRFSAICCLQSVARFRKYLSPHLIKIKNRSFLYVYQWNSLGVKWVDIPISCFQSPYIKRLPLLLRFRNNRFCPRSAFSKPKCDAKPFFFLSSLFYVSSVCRSSWYSSSLILPLSPISFAFCVLFYLVRSVALWRFKVRFKRSRDLCSFGLIC